MDFEGVEKEVVEWHRETFPAATIDAIEIKFHEETIEFCDAAGDESGEIFNDESMEEFADMCIVYMAGLAKLGKPFLTSLIAAKLAINKGREWGKETENGDRPRVK